MRPLLVGLAVAEFLPGGRSLSGDADAPMVCSGQMEEVNLCENYACDTGPACDPVNGEWGVWNEWSSCSCSGVMERYRSIAQHGSCGGVQVSGPEIEATFCQPDCKRDEPKMCELSSWGDWSSCDKNCGGGQRNRDRSISQDSENCGTPCTDALEEAESCNTHDCGIVQDCLVEDWSSWSYCDRNCGGGQQMKTRKIVEASGGGAGCKSVPLEATQGCNEECCPGEAPRDCVWGDWADWSACSETCDGGHRSRAREISQSPLNGGKECDSAAVMESGPCMTAPCVSTPEVDGMWGDWGDWNTCSRSCGSGFRSRARRIDIQPSQNGKPVEGPEEDYDDCNLQSCDTLAIDCEFGDWSDWAACSATFKGTQARSRVILRYAERGGRGCSAALAQVTTCNVMTLAEMRGPTVDCSFTQWNDWRVCSKSCGGGSQTRQRAVGTLASNLGKGCDGPVHESQACHEEVCNEDCDQDKDCQWGEWGKWSACSVQCGGGEKTRYRGVKQPAMNMGAECAPIDSREVAPCHPTPCGTERFCVWGAWSALSECSAPCGPGTQKRTRDLEISYSAEKGEAIDSTILAQVPAQSALPTLAAGGAGFATIMVAAATLGAFRRPSSGAQE